MKNPIKTILAISLAVALSGCNTVSTRHADQSFDNGGKVVTQYNDQTSPSWDNSTVSIDRSGFYAAQTPIEASGMGFENNYPESFNKKAMLTISPSSTISDVAQYVSKATGYRVTIDPDAFGPATGSNANPSSGNQSNMSVGNISYGDGSLAGLLDSVTARFQLHWNWSGDSVRIYKYQTQVFQVAALAGKTTYTSNLNTTSSSMAQGGGRGSQASSNNKGTSGQNTSVSGTDDAWEEIQKAVETVASKDAAVTPSPTAGMIVVRDTPEKLAIIGKIIAQYNKVYSKQILLKVQVYSVERSDSDNYGADWNAIWKTAASKFGFKYSTGGNTSSGLSSGGNQVTLTKNGGPWNGSSAVFSALSGLGKTTLLTNNSILTLNGKTAPLNVSTEQAYVQEFATTLAGTSGSPTTTITPGVVTGGFAMNFTPRILGDNNILMHYTVDLSTINKIVNYTSPNGSAGVQLPTRTVRNFFQDAKLHSGDTVVLTGFQQTDTQDTSSGIGSAKLWGLGGAKNNSAVNRTIVIVVTPYIEN